MYHFKKNILLLISVILTLTSCQDPYEAEYEIQDSSPILIVEGFINMDGNSKFKLSQTVPVNSDTNSLPVTQATISIETTSNNVYSTIINNSATGDFQISHPELDVNEKYRLRIKTLNKEFVSEFVEPLLTSEIDAIDWIRSEDGLDFFVSTNNKNSTNKFYRWEFEEDWRFSSKYISAFIFDGTSVRQRENGEGISTCYLSQSSSDILIASTETIQENVIQKKKILSIPNLSEKVMSRYSLLVKQFNISKQAFIYWEIMKKNSESVGDIFGSMPSELKGNITNIANSQEPVIGMIEASKPTTKRIYINYRDLGSPWLTYLPFYDGCTTREIEIKDAFGLFSVNPSVIPVYDVYKNETGPDPTHYAYTTQRCTDCSIRGKKAAPDFWIENE